jgi:transcriptional regulator of acetoin/glycerol metabolism
MNIGTTDKVKSLMLLGKTQEQIYKQLDISKNTFYQRLKKHNWKKPEIKMISEM